MPIKLKLSIILLEQPLLQFDNYLPFLNSTLVHCCEVEIVCLLYLQFFKNNPQCAAILRCLDNSMLSMSSTQNQLIILSHVNKGLQLFNHPDAILSFPWLSFLSLTMLFTAAGSLYLQLF